MRQKPCFLTHRVSGGESEAASSTGSLGLGEDGRFLRQLGHTKGTPPQFGLVLTRVESWRTGSNILCGLNHGIGTRSVSSSNQSKNNRVTDRPCSALYSGVYQIGEV